MTCQTNMMINCSGIEMHKFCLLIMLKRLHLYVALGVYFSGMKTALQLVLASTTTAGTTRNP